MKIFLSPLLSTFLSDATRNILYCGLVFFYSAPLLALDIEEVLRLDRKVFRNSLGADLVLTASSQQKDEEVFFLVASTRARSSDEDISAKTLGLDFYLIDSLGHLLWQHSLTRYEYSSEFSPQVSYLMKFLSMMQQSHKVSCTSEATGLKNSLFSRRLALSFTTACLQDDLQGILL